MRAPSGSARSPKGQIRGYNLDMRLAEHESASLASCTVSRCFFSQLPPRLCVNGWLGLPGPIDIFNPTHVASLTACLFLLRLLPLPLAPATFPLFLLFPHGWIRPQTFPSRLARCGPPRHDRAHCATCDWQSRATGTTTRGCPFGFSTASPWHSCDEPHP